MNFSEWMKFFESKIYNMQFEFKNKITKAIINLFFKYDKTTKFIQTLDQISQILAFLINEIIFFN